MGQQARNWIVYEEQRLSPVVALLLVKTPINSLDFGHDHGDKWDKKFLIGYYYKLVFFVMHAAVKPHDSSYSKQTRVATK